MPDVFLSYSRKDRDFVDRLRAALEAKQRTVWVDRQDIIPSEEWNPKIHEGIDESSHFVFIISPDSVISVPCADEIAHAVSSNKRLLPVFYRDPSPAVPAEPIRARQYFFFRPEDDFDATLGSLIRALDADPDWVNRHTWLLVQARHWEAASRHPSLTLRGPELRSAVEWLAAATPQRDPQPTALQKEFIAASQKTESEELEKIAQLYRNAIARQLAAQAELLRQQQPDQLETSILLAMESLSRQSTPEGAESLRRGLLLFPPERARIRCPDRVTGISIHPSGNFLTAACGDAVRLWSNEGRELAAWPHAGPVRAVAFSPDGRYLATAGGDITGRYPAAAHIYEVNSGREIRTLAHAEAVADLDWSPAAPLLLATATSDLFIRLWDCATGRITAQLQQGVAVNIVRFSPNGQVIAGVEFVSDAIFLWPGAGSNPPRRLQHPGADRISAICFSPDGKLLAAADGFMVSRNRTVAIRFWNVETGAQAGQIYVPGVTYSIQSMAFTPDGRYLLTMGGDRTARLLAVEDGREIQRMPHDDTVEAVAISRDGSWFATGSGDRSIRLWENRRPQEEALVELEHIADSKNAFAFALHPDGDRAAVAAWELRMFSVRSRQPVGKRDLDGLALGLDFSPDGKLLAVAGKTGSVSIIDSSTLKTVAELKSDGFTARAAFSRSGALCAVAEWSGKLVLHDLRTLAVVRSISLDGIVQAFAFGANDNIIAAATQSGAFVVLDLASGAERIRVQEKGLIWCVASSPSGDRVCAGIETGLRIWDVSGREIALLPHRDLVTSAAFSPDGRFLVTSVRSDRTARVWDLERRVVIANLPHEAVVYDARFTPDGRFIVTASSRNDDCLVNLWYANPVDLLAAAKKRIRRELTPDELRFWLPDEGGSAV